MNEEQEKKIVAENLTKFRKAKGLTQVELAERLNYSDKSISKWERGEGFPDIFILKEMAEFYGIKLDDFFSEKEVRIKKKRPIKNEIIIPALALGIAWFVIVTLFAIALIFFIDKIPAPWLLFIYGIPVSGIILIVFMAIYKKKFLVLVGESITLWGVALSVYFTLIILMAPNAWMWLIFIVCVPIQIMAILYYLLKNSDKFKQGIQKLFKRKKKEEQNEK